MKKILLFTLAVAALFLTACQNPDFNDKMIVFTGDFASKEYITILANGTYYMDYSLFYDGMIISNEIAVDGDKIESRSNVNGSVSHTLFLDGNTYFLDDENKVYFRAEVSAEDGLSSSIDYSAAKYITSGKEDIAIGEGYSYDEFSCKTVYGEDCGVKLYTNESGSFCAIVDYMGENSIERDIAAFSKEIPDGFFEIPKDYVLVDEDFYFNEYYGG